MIFRTGIENNNEGIRSIAWALEHPGCFAYGPDSDQALDNLLLSIEWYANWISRHEIPWFDPTEPELILEETFTDYDIADNFDIVEKGEYTVEPFFQHDWKPLTTQEIEHGSKLLSWSRQDLMAILSALDPKQWKIKKEGERWDIAGIANHIGGAEWWYLDRLGLSFPRQEVPQEPLERLEKVRAHLNTCLPALEGSTKVAGVDGELWSPRKILRRAAWHERDHIDHIRKLV